MPFICFEAVSVYSTDGRAQGCISKQCQDQIALRSPRDQTLKVECSVLGLTGLHSLSPAMANRK